MKEQRPSQPVSRTTDTRDRLRNLYKLQLDERLDQALEETFPASDPVALTPRPARKAR
jgi:hypothetical protein